MRLVILHCTYIPLLTAFLKNLREDMAMDVDGDPDTTQQVREVEDYGLEMDFSRVDEDDLEVRINLDIL